MEQSYEWERKALATDNPMYAQLSQAAATRALVKVSLYAIQNSSSIAQESVRDAREAVRDAREAVRDHNSQA